MESKNPAADELLVKLNAAVAQANSAEKSVEVFEKNAETARAELVSRSKTVGLLLLEARKLHPKTKDFDAFLKRVDGLRLSRAYDYMRIAGGRTTEEELRKDARERKQKSRRARKIPKPSPELKKPESTSKPEPISVTDPHVTETPKRKPAEQKTFDSPQEAASARALAEFKYACRAWLPKITAKADRNDAFMLVTLWFNSNPGTFEVDEAA
jgi:hypothetical protein